MKVWIDIDNPPQVQYLLPFRAAFAAAGVDTVITARAYGNTTELLENAGVSAHVFGETFGRRKIEKVAGVVRRARQLAGFLKLEGMPDTLLAASRPAALVARRLGIPSFIVSDYEFANVSAYILTRSYFVYPDVIDPRAFSSRGIRESRLIPFRGLKEDISFAAVDVAAVPEHRFDQLPVDRPPVRVLFRPPSETSHYYNEDSTALATATLAYLAAAGAAVIFSPREPGQVELLRRIDWKVRPIVLERAIPFVSLLKAVDLVVSGGGTMLREAAYLGVPAYSIFRSRIGGVDTHLERIGRMTLVRDQGDLSRIQIVPRGPLDKLDGNPKLLYELVDRILGRVEERRSQVPEVDGASLSAVGSAPDADGI